MTVRPMIPMLAMTLGLTGSSLALDKIQSTLEQPASVTGTVPPPLTGPFSAAWIAGRSKGGVKDVGCKVQVKLSGTGLGTGDGLAGSGDEVICLGDANIAYEGINLQTTAVFRGERLRGMVSIRLDLARETNGLCGGVDNLVVYDSRLTCYEPDPAYAPTLTNQFVSDSTQGVVVGSYAPRPASALIATQALLFPCLTGSCP